MYGWREAREGACGCGIRGIRRPATRICKPVRAGYVRDVFIRGTRRPAMAHGVRARGAFVCG